MVYQIVWSPEALRTYLATIEYLEREWTAKEVENFILLVHNKLELLLSQPKLGRISNKNGIHIV